MALHKRDDLPGDDVAGGFGTVDEKGRISLPKPIRNALGIQPGSAVAYILIDGAVLVIPQDEHLVRLMEEGTRALAAQGLTVEDLLDELPRARAQVMREAYPADFLAELERAWKELHGDNDEE